MNKVYQAKEAIMLMTKKSGKWWTIAPIEVDDMPNLT